MSLSIQEALKNVLCSRCNNYLSYFPLHINEQGQSVCGRCSADFDQELLLWKQNKPLEELLSQIPLPCINNNNGCLEFLLPSQVRKHEEYCIFRSTQCIHADCEWNYQANRLWDHVEETHPSLILRTKEFEISTVDSYSSVELINDEKNEEVFIFRKEYDKDTDKLQCTFDCLHVVDTTIKYSYEIVASNSSRSTQVEFAMQEDGRTVEIDVQALLEALNNPSVLIAQLKIERVEPEKKKREQEPSPVEMLENFECFVCMHYMIPPIFQCRTGHSICEECKATCVNCPKCTEPIENTQNYSLQNIACKLLYPCRNEECNYVGQPNLLKAHLISCDFGLFHCPIDECEWNGAKKSLVTHFRQLHVDNMLDINTVRLFVSADYLDEQDTQVYILQFNYNVFILRYMYLNRKFMFCVQFVGAPENCKQYSYEIEIVDKVTEKQKFLMRKECAPFQNDMDSIFDCKENFVFAMHKQVKDFFNDEFVFRLRMIHNN